MSVFHKFQQMTSLKQNMTKENNKNNLKQNKIIAKLTNIN